ncbi:hypothetical protein [Geobacter grbiciae]|uniref:hypothetical protein n=1 Tax=Geobacter grbiciae TaxID=155042 RepID=UPI001FE27575|nr:hypothetical protein [Geobacter grbiciae]
MPAFPQGFQCHVQPNLVAVFEAIDNRLGRGINFYLNALNHMKLDPAVKSIS